MLNEFLEKLGLKLEDLTIDEKNTYFQMLDAQAKSVLTIEKLKDYISSLKLSVEQELTKPDLDKRQDVFLKARLKNYLLLESFLLSPERTKKAMESYLANLPQAKK